MTVSVSLERRPVSPDGLGVETLYGVIDAVAQGPDLGRVLPAIVDLVSDATDCHACFIYLLEGERLHMRAASHVFQHAVGRVSMHLDEGLTGWVARHRTPAFIRENALADPRMKLFPELQEERFQSMVAVPLLDRADDVIGVVVLHTEAPREFSKDVLDYLVRVASLISSAVANARLYDGTRNQVQRLSHLATISHALAATTGREMLYDVACESVRSLLDCTACRLYLVGADRSALDLVAVSPARCASAAPHDPLHGQRDQRRLVVPLIAGKEELGALTAERETPFDTEEARLLEAVANQLAVALHKVELIGRLTEENIVRDLFQALSDGRPDDAESRARAAGYDLGRPFAIVAFEPLPGVEAEWRERVARVEARVHRLVAGALCDATQNRILALLPLRRLRDGGAERLDDDLQRLCSEERFAAGRGEIRSGLATAEQGLSEALDAARIAQALKPDGGMCAYETLGVYGYLARIADEPPVNRRHATAIAALAEYDARRRSELMATLEALLADRDGIAATARRLFIHPNTLRQRIERIEEITGLTLADEDLLSLQLALKLARLSVTAP